MARTFTTAHVRAGSRSRSRDPRATSFWKQGAEENRTQPVVMRLTGHEGEMDRQTVGVHHRVNLAGQAPRERPMSW
jgi:hypothetical protein